MKPIILFLLMAFNTSIDYLTESRGKLSFLQADEKITVEQFVLFSKQLDYRTQINLKSRLDSMESWNLDILYIEEYYFPKTDSFLVKEYYFSSIREKEAEKTTKNYCPENYYENGKSESKYFFYHEDSKEHLTSIRKHIKTRNLIDQISPVVKKEVFTSGCGTFARISAKHIEKDRRVMEKKYHKPLMPDYYLIETFIEKKAFILSFQTPVKTKHQVIMEAHPF
ncbi:MAG: hypothetical protein V4590_00435 [Bacteroidota bacterium]